MTTPFYADEWVTLYHGDAFDVLPELGGVDVLLTDPPYFKVKQDEWDNQWAKASEFLSWLGSFLDAAKPLIAANGSVWVFASPVSSAPGTTRPPSPAGPMPSSARRHALPAPSPAPGRSRPSAPASPTLTRRSHGLTRPTPATSQRSRARFTRQSPGSATHT